LEEAYGMHGEDDKCVQNFQVDVFWVVMSCRVLWYGTNISEVH